MIEFSNTDNNLMYWVTHHPYSVGQVICNVFYAGDCVTVTNQGVPVYLNGGECKLYQPKQIAYRVSQIEFVLIVLKADGFLVLLMKFIRRFYFTCY